MSPATKLATGLLASLVLADLAYLYERQALLAKLGRPVARVLLAHGVTDGAANWTDARGFTRRTARLSGTADAATRARIAAEVAAVPGIHAVTWR
jgi:hypothetical protein